MGWYVFGMFLSLGLMLVPYGELYNAMLSYPENGMCIDSVGDSFATGIGNATDTSAFPPAFTCKSRMNDGTTFFQSTVMPTVPVFWVGLAGMIFCLAGMTAIKVQRDVLNRQAANPEPCDVEARK
jgi:hypothetical protein